MALTKGQVKEILAEAEVSGEALKKALDAIITGHTESIEALREERDNLRAEVAKLQTAEAKVKELKTELDNAKEKISKGEKYDELKAEFDEYKAKVGAEKTKASKEKAFKELLANAGIPEKRHSAIIKVTDLKDYELTEDGKFKGEDKITSAVKDEWADFISTEHKEGAKTANPAENNGGKMSKDEILKIADASARQKAIADNIDLFE